MVSVYLENAYDVVPRDLIWRVMPKRGIPEECVNVILGMYRGAMTSVKTICRRTEYFEMRVALHYGSAVSPLRFSS